MEDDFKKNNSHNLFKNVRELGNKPCKHLMAAKDGDRKLKTAPDEVLKCWETYFEKNTQTGQDQRKHLMTFHIYHPWTGWTIILNRGRTEGCQMKSMKVSGSDRITAEALKVEGEKMAEMLKNICNAACHQEKLPTD